MKQWTPEAEQRREDYLAEVAKLLHCMGESVGDLLEELRAHARNEADLVQETVVTEAHIERVLQAMGSPSIVAGIGDEKTESQPAAHPALPPEKSRVAKGKQEGNVLNPKLDSLRGWITLLGIVLPAAAIALELALGPMASFYMSPMPTIGHLILLIAVPIGIWVLQTRVDADRDWKHPRFTFLTLGFVLAISGAYSVALVESIPLCAIGIILAGAGLIGFAPYTALLASILLIREYRRAGLTFGSKGMLWMLAGAAPALVLLGAFHGREVLIEHHVSKAMESDGSPRRESIARLRDLDSATYLQRRYLTLMGGVTMNGGRPLPQRLLASFDVQPYRELYFWVVGQNVEDAPEMGRSIWRMDGKPGHRFMEDGMRRGRWDLGRVPSLSLQNCTLDANIEGFDRGGFAYSELVLEFRNNSQWVEEAQCQIELPPGGVASRLTLWINDEPHEAAFGGKAQVEQAYQEVAVVQRRDPALLVSAGKDRVFLRCFPVPANGTMKVRVGITSPVTVRNGRGYYIFPKIVGENFKLGKGTETSVWIESTAPIALASDNLDVAGFASGEKTVRATGADGQPVNGGYVLIDGAPTTGETRDVLGDHAVVQKIEPLSLVEQKPLWIVIDGSASVANVGIDWRAFFNAFPQDLPIHVVVSGEEVLNWEGTGEREKIAAALEAYPFEGGQEFYSDLADTLLEAQAHRGNVLLIHGAQPLFEGGSARIEQILQRLALRGDVVSSLYTISVAGGRQAGMAVLEERVRVTKLAVIESIQASLNYFAARGGADDMSRTYTLVPRAEGEAEGTGHLVRLAIADHVGTLLASPRPEAVHEARELATRYRLVTPVSGAVVLERKEQYDRHNLNPDVNLDAVPAIPEPETWAMLIAGAIVVLVGWIRWRRKMELQDARAALGAP